MLFNTINFIIFFHIVVAVYFLTPARFRWLWLLGCSFYFYMCWKAKYIVLIGFSILVTWFGSMVMDSLRKKDPGEKTEKICRAVLWIVILLNLAVLFIFKYYNFFAENVALLGVDLPLLRYALPVGISFYTFQALGYSIDVYRKTIEPERNILRYSLFVSFFPQLVAGPIERASNLLSQLQKPTSFDIDNLRKGVLTMGYGLLMKVVIADRLSVFVDSIYSDWSAFDGLAIAAATVVFAIQIYCDFASYSIIAKGAAKVLGFDLMRNFNFPYGSRNLGEYWSRWHISLSKWFEDYIYTPFVWREGADRKRDTYIGFILVFLVSGFWHGAKWTFVIWGMIHGFYRVFGALTKKKRKELAKKTGLSKRKKLYDRLRVMTTFLLVDFTYIFFRADSVGDAFGMIGRIFGGTHLGGLASVSLSSMGLDIRDVIIVLLSLAAVFVIDRMQMKTDVADKVLEMKLPVRWRICLTLFLFIVVFGIYGPRYDATPFIYFQF